MKKLLIILNSFNMAIFASDAPAQSSGSSVHKENTIENQIKIPHVPFYFMRHGETDWNKERRFLGQTDVPLNEVGVQQAHAVAKGIAHLQISKIVSSPLQRARKTAEIIGTTLNVTITHLDELKECHWGAMEGQYKGNVGLNGEFIEQWKMGADMRGAEHRSKFLERVATGLKVALESNKDEKPILIVAHGGVYWAIHELLKLEYTPISNCCPVFYKPVDGVYRAQYIDIL